MLSEQNFNEIYADTLKKMENLTEKQKRVLQSALELFSTKGFEATSSQEIAKHAGVSVGSVYHTFPNKQAILSAVLLPIFEGAIHTVANQFVDNTFKKGFSTLEELVEVTLTDRINFINENIKVIRLLFGQMIVKPEFLEQVKKFFMEQSELIILPTINKFKEEKKIVDLPIDRILQILFNPLAVYIGKRILDINSMTVEEEILFSCKNTLILLKPWILTFDYSNIKW